MFNGLMCPVRKKWHHDAPTVRWFIMWTFLLMIDCNINLFIHDAVRSLPCCRRVGPALHPVSGWDQRVDRWVSENNKSNPHYLTSNGWHEARSLSLSLSLSGGLPKGSVLGPILFINYINNIDVELHFHVKFADDTQIGNSVISNHDTQSLQ